MCKALRPNSRLFATITIAALASLALTAQTAIPTRGGAAGPGRGGQGGRGAAAPQVALPASPVAAPIPPALDFVARWNTLKANANATLSGLSMVVDTLLPEKFRQKPLTVLVALAMFETSGPRELTARRVTILLGDPRFGNGVERFQSVPAAAPPNGVPPAFLDAFARQLAVFPRLLEFDQLLETASPQAVAYALSRLVTAAGVAPNFQALILTWLTAKAIS